MPLLTLTSEALRLAVLPEAGASVTGLELRVRDTWVAVLRPTPQAAIGSLNSSEMASFVLAPYSNRIRDARFSFLGREHRLRPNTPDGHAIHGDVRKRPWQVRSLERERVALAFDSRDFADINFPFPFSVDLVYALAPDRFETEIALRNAGDSPMPAGVGFHPYYERTLLDPAERVELEARVTGAYPELVPTRGPRPLDPREDFAVLRPIADTDLDTCFSGWDGRARICWPGSKVVAEVDCDPTLGHLIVFTPPGKPFFAVEPVSHANNGFNLLAAGVPGSGVATLAPQQVLRARFGLRLTPAGGDPAGRGTPSA